MNLAMRPVANSSNIAAIGYDAASHTLAVAFKGSSGTYTFEHVPPAIDDEFRAIEAEGGSVGKFFQASVRNRFPSLRLPIPDVNQLPNVGLPAGS